ncbi:S-adenosyl-L-methionine dependent methyltransferase [Lichtheimia hyalospora FSU 10163]|nr:S-adenosyl-L-methionine dependent methyltransferase [Lichtheimia hyalospora FSU 10163]
MASSRKRSFEASFTQQEEKDLSRNPPNFEQLAQEYPSFRPFVRYDRKGRPCIEFKDPAAVRMLNWCILKSQFSLDVTFPHDRLCPPVPSRLDYIRWIEDILKETMPDSSEPVHGIDIGVGASCIYPLLGCARNPEWHFLGTDIDEASLNYAKENVEWNQLQDRISLRLNEKPDRIFMLEDTRKYAFCMCNPPFYESKEEVDQGLENKELEPSSVCTGSTNEMITPGGELQFISQIINESLEYKDRIMWYTSLIGLKKTIKPITQKLKSHNITNYIVTSFCQGKTTRWAIAWSFGSIRINDARPIDEYRPKSQFTLQVAKSADYVREQVEFILSDLRIPFQDQPIRGAPRANTWSRAARRQLKKKQKIQQEDTPLFLFQMTIEDTQDESCNLTCKWTEGENRDAFESFWNHVKKRVEEACDILRGSSYNG